MSKLWIAAAALLLMVSVAHAQDIGATIGPTADQVYAASANGPVMGSVTAFTTLYNGLFDPIDTAEAGIQEALRNYVSPLLKGMIIVLVMMAGMSFAAGGATGERLMAFFLRSLVRPAVIGQILASTDQLNQWVILPLKGIPAGISNAVAGVGGGAPLTGGAPFDAIATSLSLVKDTAFQHTTGIIDAIGQMVLIAVTYFFGMLFLGATFVVFLAVHLVLDLVISLAPLAIICAVFPATRGFLSGWINVVATQIVGLILIVILLGISMRVQTTLLAPILAAPANAGVSGMGTALVQMVVCQFCIMVLVVMSQGIAGAICGGGVAIAGPVGTVAGGMVNAGKLAKKAFA